MLLTAGPACVYCPLLQGDDKQGMAGGMQMQQMAPFFAPPGAFFANPMMQVGAVPAVLPAAGGLCCAAWEAKRAACCGVHPVLPAALRPAPACR